MTIEQHLKDAIAEIDAAMSSPASLRVMERNALNLALGHIYGVLDARKQRAEATGAKKARVAGDPGF